MTANHLILAAAIFFTIMVIAQAATTLL